MAISVNQEPFGSATTSVDATEPGDPQPGVWISIEAAARLLDVHRATVHQLIRKGRLTWRRAVTLSTHGKRQVLRSSVTRLNQQRIVRAQYERSPASVDPSRCDCHRRAAICKICHDDEVCLAYQAGYTDGRNKRDKASADDLKAARARRLKRIAEGKCTRCGKKKPEGCTTCRCRKCQDRENAADRAKRRLQRRLGVKPGDLGKHPWQFRRSAADRVLKRAGSDRKSLALPTRRIEPLEPPTFAIRQDDELSPRLDPTY